MMARVNLPLELLVFGSAVVMQSPSPAVADWNMIPDAMLGCWEDVAMHDGTLQREFIEISRSGIAASFLPDHDPSQVAVELDTDLPPGIIHSVSISLSAQSEKVSGFEHTLWMEEPDNLRVSGFWDPEEAEPDPVFSRCRPPERHGSHN